MNLNVRCKPIKHREKAHRRKSSESRVSKEFLDMLPKILSIEGKTDNQMFSKLKTFAL